MNAIKKPSPVAAAKDAQGFVQKPAPSICANCKNLTSDLALPSWMVKQNEKEKAAGKREPWKFDIYSKKSNLRCGLGGFAVGKTSTCNAFERKTGGAA